MSNGRVVQQCHKIGHSLIASFLRRREGKTKRGHTISDGWSGDWFDLCEWKRNFFTKKKVYRSFFIIRDVLTIIANRSPSFLL